MGAEPVQRAGPDVGGSLRVVAAGPGVVKKGVLSPLVYCKLVFKAGFIKGSNLPDQGHSTVRGG